MKIILCLILVATVAFSSTYAKSLQYGSNQHNNKINAKKSHQQATSGKHKSASLASPSSSEKESQILHHDVEMKGDGTYHYDFETSNGIKRTEQGAVDGTIQGSSSYISPEGIEIKTTYVADETGYHPVGDHIPKTPDYILRALEYIRNHPYIEKDYYTGEVKQASFTNKKPLTITTTKRPAAHSKKSKNDRKKSTHNSKNNFRH